MQLTDLSRFIVDGKQATYAGDGAKLLPYRLSSHDLQFLSGDWAYHDSYLGESDFIGQEVVYHQARVVWGMNYFGYILEPTLITSAEAHSEGELEYIDTNEGDVSFFTGREWIERRGVKVYELLYHGGLIK